MKTISAKFEADQRKWILVDAEDRVLGAAGHSDRHAAAGKTFASFHPVDCGDFVVVINAEKGPSHWK